jgi:lipopolysaccharide/colanic/teichoic acid biosynthesis glycosyltransferase
MEINQQTIITIKSRVNLREGKEMERDLRLSKKETILQQEINVIQRDLTAYYLLKRIIDVILSSIALIVFFPLMAAIAILIHFDSPGPVIFSQKRVGSRWQIKNGHLCWERTDFNFYKFRTMFDKADPSIHKAFVKALINHDEKAIREIQKDCGEIKKITNDSRITRLGHFLRRSSLDEMPQFWNVLKGEMSLVGPRPAIPYEVEMYKPWYFRRFEAKPGMTGLWQVIARNSCDFDEMVRLDIEYVESQSFWLDIKVLFLTPLVVFLHRGAV